MSEDKALVVSSESQAVNGPDQEKLAKLAQIAVNGDLSKMNLQQQASFLTELARAEGIPAFPRPWMIMTDKKSGKQTLVSTKARAEALRARDKISITPIYEGWLRLEVDPATGIQKVNTQFFEAVYVASTPDGSRKDTDRGITFIGGLVGQDLADKIMSAITKGKNRVTYSITGSSGLDESEASDMGLQGQQVQVLGPRTVQPQLAGNISTSYPPPNLTNKPSEPIFEAKIVDANSEPLPPVAAPKG